MSDVSLLNKVKFDFLKRRWLAFIFSIVMLVGSVVITIERGLNFGIDFTGGILIETEFQHAPPLAKLRTMFTEAAIGDISLQTLGKPELIMIRVGQSDNSSQEQAELVKTIKQLLETHYDENITYRKIDYVGPKVGNELIKSGFISMLLAVAAIVLYVWFRFEWQYGVGAIASLAHDTVLTIGFFSITRLDFNLTSIAAILTIVGYSINDTVVVFDRIRENLRKYKAMPLGELINMSINHTLSRTLLTSFSTILALIALVLLGGETVKSFSWAALFGIAVGTYSSIYIASPMLIYMNLRKKDVTAS